MMLILLFIYFAVVLFGMKVKLNGTADYLSVDNTQAVKGIFILMVFLTHFNSYTILPGSLNGIYYKFFVVIGQALVTLFLFYSGYGVMESIKKKGKPYLKSFPKNRILRTLFNFDCAVILFLLLSLAMGGSPGLKQVLLSFIGWESLGNSNWYIFAILLLYLLTYIVFSFFSEKHFGTAVLVLGALVCALVFVTYRYGIKPQFWYDTALCYVFGAAYSLSRAHIEKVLNKSILIWLGSVIVLAVMFVVLRSESVIADIAANLVFAALVVIFTMHVTFKNRILKWCGENLFELYILQRIPMILFKELGLHKIHVFLYFAASVAFTVLISVVFKAVIGRLGDAIFKTSKKVPLKN